MEDRTVPKSSILPKRITKEDSLLDGKKVMKRNESGAGNMHYTDASNDIF